MNNTNDNQNTNQLAILGLATMGKNFAKNFASKNIKIAVYNRSFVKTQELLGENNANIFGFESLKKCILSLQLPRKIFLLVKSGPATDQTIEQILPFLSKGDIIVDCGNSNWEDTITRQNQCKALGINFVGCGISGGSDGALLGPSLMPSGEKIAVDSLLPILRPVSAKDFDGGDCVCNIGSSGSGHFVKMVHNGIEYAMMQGLAEIYDILKYLGLSTVEIKEYFDYFNTGDLESFLTEITCQILSTKDNLGDGFLLEKINYCAGAKGTGKWTVEAGMNFGVSVSNIFAGLAARVVSEENFVNNVGSKNVKLTNIQNFDKQKLKTTLYSVLESIYMTSYLQGLELIQKANSEKMWEIDILEVIRIWQGGCIIRSKMLKKLFSIYQDKSKFIASILPNTKAIFELTNFCNQHDIKTPTPVIDSTKNYILSLQAVSLPQNLTQAQRDFFGAHTYTRNDKDGIFTGGWKSE